MLMMRMHYVKHTGTPARLLISASPWGTGDSERIARRVGGLPQQIEGELQAARAAANKGCSVASRRAKAASASVSARRIDQLEVARAVAAGHQPKRLASPSG